MNAFLQILRQLFEAVTAESWRNLAYFPFALENTDRSKLYDLAVFHQTAREAYGIAWIDFKKFDELLIFPFCMVRYRTDEALISLAPWSIRDARADETFYHYLRSALKKTNPLSTMQGNLLSLNTLAGEPALTAVSIDQDSNHLLVRVDALEAYKIFRTTSRENPVSLEIDVLEYLTQSVDYDGAAKLVSSLQYATPRGTVHNIAVSMSYVQSKGNLWNQMLIHLQEARYPRWNVQCDDLNNWKSCLETAQRTGRLVADFHRAMMKAKKPSTIAPLSPDPNILGEWKLALIDYKALLVERALMLKPKLSPEHQPLLDRLSTVSAAIEKEVIELETSGLLIQTHGHLHLGQILVGNEKLTLLDYQSAHGKIHRFESMRQSALDDYAALFVSFQFAWSISTHGPESVVFKDILDKKSEYGAYFYRKSSEHVTQENPEMNLDGLHAAYSKAYFRALKDDPLTSELFPPNSAQFESLLKIYMFLRCTKELMMNAEPGNPKAAVALQLVSQLDGWPV